MSFRDYLQHGWKLCVIPPGSKGPTGAAATGWNRRDRAIGDPAMGPQIAGAGLCHAWSGTCAIDVDDYPRARDYLASQGVDLDALMNAPQAVRINSGRPGRAKLLYALPEPLASVKLGPYEQQSPKTGKPQTYHALELRCATADGLTVQDVLPETIHPETGRPYTWAYGDELIGHWSALPELPEAMHALWLAQLGPTREVSGPVAPVGAEFAEIEALLASFEPDCSYEEWIRIGMAVHHETQGKGFALWDAWSAKGEKYKGAADLRAHWASFRASTSNPVTLGGLRAAVVAKPEDFPLDEPSAEAAPDAAPEDMRPRAVIARLLEQRLVFVAGQDAYYDLGSKGGAWLTDRGIRHLFCPHMPTIQTTGKDGEPKATKPDPVAHLRESKSKIVVDAVGFHPGEGRIYTEDGLRYANAYQPIVVQPLPPRPQEIEAFEFLWSRLVDTTFQRWLLRFYAHALQRPGVKIQTAPVLFSEGTGTGKNTIAKVLPELLFGSRWVRTMSGNVLGSTFNDVCGETWFLYLEELRTGSTKVDRMHTANKLKAWITDSFIEIHPKGRKPYDIRNRIQVTATSNFDDALQLDNNDRRWAVCEVNNKPLSEREATDLYAFLNSERAPGVLRKIFMDAPLDGFKPAGRAPETQGRTAMIRAGLGSWESKIVSMMMRGEEPFHRDLFTLQDLTERLGALGPHTGHALSRVLRRHPFHCRPMPPAGQGERLWAWRNALLWAARMPRQRLAHLETGERHGNLLDWSADVPATIRAMSVDADADEATQSQALADCADLL